MTTTFKLPTDIPVTAIRPGQDWVKQTSGRLAQVSGFDTEHAYMYWPDRDTQTKVARYRLNYTTEWLPASQHQIGATA